MKSVLCAAIIALTSQAALAVSPLPPGCTAAHEARCGGILGSSGGTCTCTVTTWTPRVVTNAKKGDLALVPLSAMTSPDDAAIRITMTALAQNFSHSLIHDSQGRVVHATAVGGVGQEGMHIDPADLMNATPGAVNTSIDWAFNNQRFSDEGLVGKPMSEVLRPMLENAADEATLNVGNAYYKVADFTDNTGMSFTFSADRTVNRRGTQCAGFVWDAFDRAGIHISRHAYPLDLRTDVANTLWAGIFDLAPWPKKHAIANQVVNCFAGFDKVDGVLSCRDTSDRWRSGVGTGTTVSPDNLLPVSFLLTATGPFTDTGVTGYEWHERTGFRTIVDSQKLPGDVVDSSRRCDSSGACVSFGAPTTVFQVVELQNIVGGFWTTTVLTSF